MRIGDLMGTTKGTKERILKMARRKGRLPHARYLKRGDEITVTAGPKFSRAAHLFKAFPTIKMGH